MWDGDKELTVGDVERLWKTDRLRLKKLNTCFSRLVNLYETTREGLAK
jgi:hypothetical protein